MKPTKELFEKVLKALTEVDEYCHSIQCEDCPFYLMKDEGSCPVDKIGMGKEIYMKKPEVVKKAKERITKYATDNNS